VDLTTYILDVASLLFHEDLSDVVLAGHSYGGMVISGVASKVPERLSQLIYLDAYVRERRGKVRLTFGRRRCELKLRLIQRQAADCDRRHLLS
jgi:pimeloyl-ACP methyl ester carboxylesterase